MPDSEIYPAIEDAAQRQLYHYWLLKRGHRRLPSRADIDPVELRDILGDVGLIDVEPGEADGPPRFRYRLIGTAMVDFFGSDFTGETVEESKTGEYARKLLALYTDCAARAAPMYWEGVFEYQNRVHWRVKRLLLPLTDSRPDEAAAPRAVSQILFSTTFGRRDQRRDAHPGQDADAIVDMRERRRVIG